MKSNIFCQVSSFDEVKHMPIKTTFVNIYTHDIAYSSKISELLTSFILNSFRREKTCIRKTYVSL